jgi:hypothetical protein
MSIYVNNENKLNIGHKEGKLHLFTFDEGVFS